MNSNLHDKLKIDISESGLEVTNSIEAFNKNLNKMDKYLNSKNESNTNPNINISNSKIDTNIKASSELENINDSSSIIELDNNRYNLKINNNISKNSISTKKIADPSSDLLCQKLQQKIDTLNYDNYALIKKNKDLLSKNEELKLNLASINQAKETELQMINEELINAQNKLKLKEQDILKMKEKIKLYEKDINQLEKNKNNIFELRTENDKLKKNQKKLNETINKFEQNLDFYKNKYNEVSSGYEILKKEKEKMNIDTFVHKEKNKELNIDNERLKNEINELKEEKNQLLKKISDYDMNQKKKYNELIDRAKQKMEVKQKEEIERIQNDENNIMKIQIKSLEEQNEDLKIKIHELKESQKQNNNDDMIYEDNKKQITLLNDEVSYLKLQLQLKDSENKRLTRIYTENMELITELNNENNSCKEKLKLLSAKLNEVASNSNEEVNQVKEKIALLRAQNQSYEEQDNTFDKIFSEALLDIERNNKDEETRNMILTINELPKGNNKRISQFMLLANNLKKLSQDNLILNSKLENALIENKKHKDESNLFQNIAQNNNEPYEYLLKEIAKKDSQILYLKEEANEKDIRYKQVMKENERLNEKYNDIEKDLKQHLENIEKIDNLNFLVNKIAENQKKFLGNDKNITFDDQIVIKNKYTVPKNDPYKKGKQKYK